MFSLKNFQNGKRWMNWSERYVSFPTYYVPKSIEEIVQVVKQHASVGKTIRVTGAAHSFSPVALPESSALTLHHLRGLLSVDNRHPHTRELG